MVEVLVVLAVLFIVAALVLPGPHGGMVRAPRIQCVNNLKQVGLAFRIWEGDYGNNYPTAVPETNGGSMEFTTGMNEFRHFQVMSNEVSTPKVLFCPAETDQNRFVGTNFVDLNNSNLSFFVGVDSKETMTNMILCGDHNITNGTPIHNGLLAVTTNTLAGWTSEMHNKVGNILLDDGSVQQTSIADLRKQIAKTGVATNRLQMPVLGP